MQVCHHGFRETCSNGTILQQCNVAGTSTAHPPGRPIIMTILLMHDGYHDFSTCMVLHYVMDIVLVVTVVLCTGKSTWTVIELFI